MKRYFILSISVCALFLLLSACSSTSRIKAQQDQIQAHVHVTRFEFGSIGNVEVSSTKNTLIDGKAANYAVLFAQILAEGIEKRNIKTSPQMHTRGGIYLAEELRGTNRNLRIHVYITPKTFAMGYIVPAGGDMATLTKETFTPISSLRGTYKTDEEFYEGVKAEFRPLAEKMLDIVFLKAKAQNIINY